MWYIQYFSGHGTFWIWQKNTHVELVPINPIYPVGSAHKKPQGNWKKKKDLIEKNRNEQKD